MPVASLREHTNAVLATLQATNVLVGDAVKPSGAGWTNNNPAGVFTPYMVLHRLLGTFDGPIAAPDVDAELEYQVTCVGATRDQAEWVADKAITALVGQTVAAASRSLLQRIYLTDAGMSRRDDTVQPPVFYATPRFLIYTTPS